MMKHKRRAKDPVMKVISDPKKLAWLKLEIDKRKSRGAPAPALEKGRAEREVSSAAKSSLLF